MRTPIDSLGQWLAELRPSRLAYGRIGLALMIGSLGAAIFLICRLPLPWMLGPMLFAMVAALGGAPISMPNAIRTPMLIVLGATVGATATPELFSKAVTWYVPMAGLLIVLLLGTCASYLYFRRIGRYDRPTAYFSAVPGSLAEMILVGDSKGGDVRAIALAHASRVAFFVMVVPLFAYASSGVARGAQSATSISVIETPLSGLLWFACTYIIGGLLGWLARTQTAYFLAPILVSTLIHSTGWSDFKVPVEFAVGAQVVIGLSLGCRFAGTRLRAITTNLLISLGACALVLAIALVSALVIERICGQDVLLLLLAYSPAGVAEMSLVAVALHADVTFVVLHHLLRILALSAFARLVFTVLVRRRARK